MKKFILSILVTLTSLLFAGCVVEESGRPHRHYAVVQPAPPPAEVIVVEPTAPPPPRVEVISPRPNMGFMWQPGSWEWAGKWVWVPGHWGPPPKRDAVWIGGHWERRGHGHVWIAGHWR